jgi:hypothetical protein
MESLADKGEANWDLRIGSSTNYWSSKPLRQSNCAHNNEFPGVLRRFD